jgi:hypothetical protein
VRFIRTPVGLGPLGFTCTNVVWFDLDYKHRSLFPSGSHDTLETLLETAAELRAIAFILDEMEAEKAPENDPQRTTANDMRDKITLRLLSAARETFTTLLYPHGEQLMSADFLMQFTENCYNGEEQVRDALKAKHKFTEEISGDTFRPSPGRTPMCASRNSRVMMIPEWWCSSSHLSVATRCTMRSGGRRRPPRPESPTQWLPDRQQVGVVEGDFAVVSLALACVKSQVAMVSRRRWDTALYHPPSPQPPGKRGPKPLKGKRQHRLQAWAERADTPWEIVEVDWYGDHRKQLWGFSFTALWHTRGCPPVDIRFVLVGDPEGKLRMAAFCCTDLQATPVQILEWVVIRWEFEVTCEGSCSHLGVEPNAHGRTKPWRGPPQSGWVCARSSPCWPCR